MSPSARGRGRPPADRESDARGAILAAARAAFAERGFDGATIRAIAGRAGVDPALVHHYFGTKQGLFLVAMEVPFSLEQAAGHLAGVPRERLAEAVLRYALPIWDGPARDHVRALLRTSLGDERSSSAMQGVLVEGIAMPVLRLAGVPEDELAVRAALLESVVLGVLLGRHVMDVPVLAGLDVDQVVACYAPAMQRLVSAPLDELVG